MLSLSHTDHYLATIVTYDFQHPPLNDRTVNKKTNKPINTFMDNLLLLQAGQSFFVKAQ